MFSYYHLSFSLHGPKPANPFPIRHFPQEGVQQKDVVDILHRILHKKNNGDTIRAGKKFNWSLIPAAGYTLQTGFAGVVSGNIGFYQQNSKGQKISNITTSYTYSQYKQTIFPLYANIWTRENKINFISDFKYLNYPSEVYGLGGKRISIEANSNTAYTVNFKYIKLHQSIMFKALKDFYVGGGIYYDQFWSIKITDSLGKRINHILSRDLKTSERASGLAVKALYDNRLNQINPQNGEYLSITYRPNFTFLGSQSNWSSLQIDARKYVRFPANSENTLAFWGFAWLTTSKTIPPYLMLPSTGWDDQNNMGRGYIQSRFRGKNMYYYENEYRFGITRNGLLGGVVFANVQSFSADLSDEYKKLLFGYGVGLRIKLNKHSSTNLAIDYGFGQNNSHGFFANIGEVF
ncbi:BamA/TamA family outer membrane protein [Chryseobacterium sp. MEBOG06]|uniref:BamA/TamA family outer membrane protein n=1 Tax=Chryseobacterium sp. MEBOG06 TaxID=2879938 RepID=UPI001EFF8EDE|nr:BamA/TamA family outer membrane protein [Chryseobacterium sp. MEBOG06]UKB82598.1 BamA/TamA family outer membrane protein [Chryseobacterium sp. MEBOG06]